LCKVPTEKLVASTTEIGARVAKALI